MRFEELTAALKSMDLGGRKLRFMEICGTHTMAAAKIGLRQLMPEGAELISGPGCPVCVTPAGEIDRLLQIAEEPGVTLACFGDLLRIPGSVRGSSLLQKRAQGADIRIVYSPIDAVALAKKLPERRVVFPGVGFETTAPGICAAILSAAEESITNFSVLPMMKYTIPAIRLLLDDPDCQIDGLLCPGHVATVLGAEAFRFLPEEYGLPAVVGGFEADELIPAMYELCRMAQQGEAALVNAYPSCVRAEGNPAARACVELVTQPCDAVWRGLGTIPNSGMTLRPEFAAYNAASLFDVQPMEREENPGCRCGTVLRGKMRPEECPLFGTVCTPADPAGPCMVSGEGSCAAAYRYRM